jgi:hypothetical protein
MNTIVKVSAFAVALVVLFGGGWLVGRAVGPVDGGANQEHTGQEHAAESADVAAAASAELPGLASAQHGYQFVPESTTLRPGVASEFRFRIIDASSAPITRFAVEHEKRLHLVVVRRDVTLYQHLHPEMATDGSWSVPLTLPAAGTYRVFADFRPEGGQQTTLGIDVHVPGGYEPAAAGAERRAATVDGYTVQLDGPLRAGTSSTVNLGVAKDGAPVTDLQTYLGAYGHLVALRAGDLAYLHVHPEAGPAGPEVKFAVEVPTAGRYRLFFDFQHGGVVRTADFTVDVATGDASSPTAPAPSTSTDGHGGHGG